MDDYQEALEHLGLNESPHPKAGKFCIMSHSN